MPVTSRPQFEWHLRGSSVALGDRTCVLGILNVTPDSFSDGGQFSEVEAAVAHGLALLDQGADLIDLGGESTRPGAEPISAAEEQGRIMPVLRGILRAWPRAILSIDTYNASTAQVALDHGAAVINDVSGGLWDPAMLPLCARYRCGVLLMHTRGRPQEWRSLPSLTADEVLPLVSEELAGRVEAALAVGVPRECIALDPGFGFGKLGAENLPLLRGLRELHELGYPLAVGVSRKGFLRQMLEGSIGRSAQAHVTPHASAVPAEAVRDATLAANTALMLQGAHIVRVHEPAAARRATAVVDALLDRA